MTLILFNNQEFKIKESPTNSLIIYCYLKLLLLVLLVILKEAEQMVIIYHFHIVPTLKKKLQKLHCFRFLGGDCNTYNSLCVL